MPETLLETLESEKTRYESMAFSTMNEDVRRYAQEKAKEVAKTISLILEINATTRK